MVCIVEQYIARRSGIISCCVLDRGCRLEDATQDMQDGAETATAAWAQPHLQHSTVTSCRRTSHRVQHPSLGFHATCSDSLQDGSLFVDSSSIRPVCGQEGQAVACAALRPRPAPRSDGLSPSSSSTRQNPDRMNESEMFEHCFRLLRRCDAGHCPRDSSASTTAQHSFGVSISWAASPSKLQPLKLLARTGDHRQSHDWRTEDRRW